VRKQIEALGWRIVDFKPALSRFGDWHARLSALPPHDAVWVPCFRQRDVAAASRHARRVRVPLIFDPLISAWDKQVFERRKFPEDSVRARRLLAWERALLQRCDRVIADTAEHAAFFRQRLGVPAEALTVVPVGAEEDLFVPTPMPATAPPEVLFVGSFIALQGPEVIVEAVRRYAGPAARFTLLGDGPLKARCVEAARGLQNLHFESWLDYQKLPQRLARAHILLGVFGSSQKTGRVIPNKAYQALAVARGEKARRGRASRKAQTVAYGGFRPATRRHLQTRSPNSWLSRACLQTRARPRAGPTTAPCRNDTCARRSRKCLRASS
jgi:glycosyltransferase involved in cell wall biosynthesis